MTDGGPGTGATADGETGATADGEARATADGEARATAGDGSGDGDGSAAGEGSTAGDGSAAEPAVQSLQTTVAVLEAVEALDDATVSRVAEAVGAAKSTVYDHLATLAANEFVVKSPDATYDVGLRFLDLGGRARRNRPIYRVAKPELRTVARRTGELVNLAVLEHGRVVYLDHVAGENAVALDTYVGKRELPHRTALGKAMLAHLPAASVDAIVDRHGLPASTDRTIQDRDDLEAVLETVRERGYAVDAEERLQRLRCVGAPVLDESGAVLGAVSISGPSQRFADEERFEELVEAVTQLANVVEINLTYGE